ncbi:MAG: hypothetical protein IKX65_06350 [Prevotella sp.]|nr:hypothetical protein [Prevotella sp.]
MKKTLLFVLMCVCATISAWAQDYTKSTSTWTSCDNNSVSERALIITINTPGSLTAAISSVDQSNYQIVKIKGEINGDDISALSNLTVATIDLQDAHKSDYSAFTFTNSSVRNLILPDNWTKAQVNAAAQAVNSNLGSAISLGTFKDADGSDFAFGSSYANKTAITAYVNTSKTLRDALIRTYSEGSNTKFGSGGFNQSTLDWSNIYGITISGNAVAQDFSKASLDFTEEGHLVFDREANEKERSKANDVRTIVGTGSSKVPAFSCNTLGSNRVVSLDLSGVIIDDANNSDLTLGEMDIVGAATRQVCIPTCSSLKTLPADFLNGNGIGVNQICIPGNIEVIKTRAFQNVRLDHVWTTGDATDIKYDNGIYVRESGEEVAHEGYLSYDAPTFNLYENVYTYYLYGTYTLPENLKLIESNAFCYESDARIKDVYSLAIETPECHVDAFSTINYTGNNTFDAGSVTTEGIVTRDAYVQNRQKYNFITMLHYPRECGTPYIQRYTDPTREYSIATGEVDGKGSTIYFPNQNEFLRAYTQGTYGYVWNAWDPTRKMDGSNEIANIRSENPYSQAGQSQANSLYTSNTVFTAKSDRTFYDTTDGGNLSKPVGQGNYWDVYWEGQQLYPQPETVVVTDEQGNTVYETVPVRNVYGEIEYDLADEGATYEGNYTRTPVVKYDKAPDGLYCHPVTQDSNGAYTLGYEYVDAEDGIWIESPYNPGSWIQYQDYMANDSQFNGKRRCNRTVSGLIPFTNQWDQTRYNIGTDYILFENCTFEYKDILDRYNSRDSYDYTPATSSDEGPFYTMQTQQSPVVRVKQNDYRGWHQFVLTGYAHNKNYEMIPYRSFITDNDWWTVCLPFDLTYKDMITFFGSEGGEVPYLSKLTYVVRDVKNTKITLMFSNNLMKYKETVASGNVHGTISTTEDAPASNAVVLHKGVPYLIRPNLKTQIINGETVITGTRQFDIIKEIYHTAAADDCLYCRLAEANDMPGRDQMQLVQNGIYTVPAFVINNEGSDQEEVREDDPNTTVNEAQLSITMENGPTFTYANGKLTHKGVEYDAEVSNKFTYSFVGSFYLSLMPQYAYFLGWDSDNQRAAFWYNEVDQKGAYTWNNNTGIICANWWTLPNLSPTTRRIHEATSVSDPARWTEEREGKWLSVVATSDNFASMNQQQQGQQNHSKSYTMDFGGEYIFVDPGYGIATSVQTLPTQGLERVQSVYTANGIYVGTSVKGLSKGVYVVNGKKYVVK